MTLLKRLIGVIAVADGRPVQSIGYRNTLPLGRIECVFENLDRWEVDEVLVVAIDRSRRKAEPDYALIDRIARLGLSTPLSYGGGVSTAEQAVRVVVAGAERVCLDSVLHDNPNEVRKMESEIGAQAIIAALPMAIEAGKPLWYDHRAQSQSPLSKDLIALLRDRVASEVLVVDWQHEGVKRGFDIRLLEHMDEIAPGLAQLAYGGLSGAEQIRDVLMRPKVMAAAVGNFLNYREHAVQHFKSEIALECVRAPRFAKMVEA